MANPSLNSTRRGMALWRRAEQSQAHCSARRVWRVMLAALLCSVVAGCAALLRGPGIDKVWPATHIYLPSRMPVRVEDANLTEIATDIRRPIPAVIFLHGCSGYYPHYLQTGYPVELSRAGFAVFVPDSFARPGRRQACGNVQSDTVGLRHAEVDEVLERLRTLPWVDQRNLFLAGHSEGGIATAMYGGGDFRAYFISGWSCRSVSAPFNSIHAPSSRPVLAIVGANDEYIVGLNAGHCGEAFGPFRNPKSRSLVLTGIGHEVNLDPQTVPTLIEFFKRELVP